MDNLLTPDEAAKVLGISTGALAQLRYKGLGPEFHRLSPRKVRYSRGALESFVASARVGAARVIPARDNHIA